MLPKRAKKPGPSADNSPVKCPYYGILKTPLKYNRKLREKNPQKIRTFGQSNLISEKPMFWKNVRNYFALNSFLFFNSICLKFSFFVRNLLSEMLTSEIFCFQCNQKIHHEPTKLTKKQRIRTSTNIPGTRNETENFMT